MLLIGHILVSDDLLEEEFMCNLSACKGACCWEGDLGAPLEEEETQTLLNIYEDIKPFLQAAGIAVIEQEGPYTYNEKKKEYATPLIDGGPCAYMVYDNNGIAQCGIELAHKAGATDFKKPISCHLYPIRVMTNETVQMEALNYDRWDICSAACEKGKKHKMPVYQFTKEALIRKYGEDFYEALDAAALDLNE
jgi:hypothetical protein